MAGSRRDWRRFWKLISKLINDYPILMEALTEKARLIRAAKRAAKRNKDEIPRKIQESAAIQVLDRTAAAVLLEREKLKSTRDGMSQNASKI